MSSRHPSNRKRPRDETKDTTDPQVDLEDASQHSGDLQLEHDLIEAAPAPKKSKMGRKPLPDQPCEHGSMAKKCQKCIYRQRSARASIRFDERGVLTRILYMWSQNLVFFSSLASKLVFCGAASNERTEISKKIDSRMAHFRHYTQTELDKLADIRAPLLEDSITYALDTMTMACPASVETVYMAKWLIDRQRLRLQERNENFEEADILTPLLGKACSQFTDKIAMMWEDDMICPGIAERDLVEHFKHWKGLVWKNRDGVFGLLTSDNECVRSIHCTGFTSVGLCDRCGQVRHLLVAERNAFKTDPPGYRLLVKSLPPSFANILHDLKVQPAQDSHLMGPEEELHQEESAEMLAPMENVDLVPQL